MSQIASHVPTLVIDHHLLRDEGWSKFLDPVRKSAEKARHRMTTAADLLREKPRPLECQRRRLYEEEKPSQEFLKWSNLPKETRENTAPPL